jgi:methylphosphotriester-DNA--protein-cysteine methyltransferase
MTLKEALERIVKALETNSTPKAVFSMEEAARYLGVSKNTLERLRPEYPDLLPVVRTSDKRIGYSRKTLDRFIEARTVTSADDERSIKLLAKGASHD